MLKEPAFNKSVILVILLFSTVCAIIGCEKQMSDNDIVNGNIDLAFIDIPWEIEMVNDVPFESLFVQETEPGSAEHEFAITLNSWVFDGAGDLTGKLEFVLTEKSPGDPPTSMTQVITYTITGKYTADETTLTIETQDIKIDVDVILEPKAVWEQQIQGITIEQLKSDLAAETKNGFKQTDSAFLFQVGAEYTWQTEQDKFTLYIMPDQKILFREIVNLVDGTEQN